MREKTKMSVEEIVRANMRNADKVRLLYLDHDKSYKEISDLIGLKVSTIQVEVSRSGYCKSQGSGNFKYGAVEQRILALHKEHPKMSIIEISETIGCSRSLVGQYLRRNGIWFSDDVDRPRGRQRAKQKREKEASANQTKREKIENFEDVADILSTKKDLNYIKYVVDTMAEDLQEFKNRATVESTLKKSPEFSPIVPDINVGDMELPKTIEEESSDNGGFIRKPYTIIEWPYVIYQGRIYEILDTDTLRDLLKNTLNITYKSKRVVLSKSRNKKT